MPKRVDVIVVRAEAFGRFDRYFVPILNVP